MKKAHGIFPPMFTIWKSGDESYDEKASEQYITWLIDNGIQSVVACGSTGENTAMFMHEQKRVIEHVVKFVAGQLPVYAGTGKYSTLETLELCKHAEAVGADGLMIILPYYFKPYIEAAMNHYRAVRQVTALPIVLYNNPHFAGYELNAQQANQLCDEGVIQAVKSAHGDPEHVSELKLACGDKLTVFYGHDFAALHGFAAGADGWLSGFPATFPKQCRALQEAVMVQRDLQKGRALWDKFIPMATFLMDPKTNEKVHWLEILKWAATVQGVPAGIPRRPLRELSEEMKQAMKKPLDILLS